MACMEYTEKESPFSAFHKQGDSIQDLVLGLFKVAIHEMGSINSAALNTQLSTKSVKKAPNKYTIYACLSNICHKLQHLAPII